jgi:hypothetical protein
VGQENNISKPDEIVSNEISGLKNAISDKEKTVRTLIDGLLPSIAEVYLKHVDFLADYIAKNSIKDIDAFSVKHGFYVVSDYIFEAENGSGKKRITYIGRRLEDFLQGYSVLSKFEKEIAGTLLLSLGSGELDREKRGTYYQNKEYWFQPTSTSITKSHALLKRVQYKEAQNGKEQK